MGDAGKKRTGGQASDPRANEKKNRAAFAAGPANPAANTARYSAETSGFSAKTARFRTFGAFGVFGTFGAKCGAAVVALALAFFTALSLVTPALAVSGTLSTEGDLQYLSVSGDGAWSIASDGVTITGKVSSKKWGSNDSTFTITNNSDQKGKLTLEYITVSVGAGSGWYADGKAQANGVDVTAGSDKTYTLESKKSIPVYILSGTGGARAGGPTTIVFKISSFQLVKEEANVTVTAGQGGKFTVDNGTALTTWSEKKSKGAAVTLKAVPDDGYQFDGWYKVENGVYTRLSAEAAYSYTVPEVDSKLQALFRKAGMAPVFSVNGTGYYSFPTAMSASKSTGKPAVLMRDYVLPVDTYTIPVGASLLIPYSASDTGTFSSKASIPSGNQSPLASHKAYVTLTVPNGAAINVDGGAVNVNAQQASNSSRTPGCVYGDYGCLRLEEGAKLTYNGGTGYIYGFITGLGEVEAKSGSNVWELMQVTDWRGGDATMNLHGVITSAQMESFVCSQYYFQSIESRYTVHSGATSGICFQVNLSDTNIPTAVPLIGSGEGLLQLGANSSITRTYYGDTDRVVWDTSGEIAVSNLELKLEVSKLGISVPVKLNTAEKVFPLQGNYTFNIGDGSTMRLTNKFQMLPGCQVNVEKGGKLISDSGTELYVFDRDDWGKYANNQYLSPILFAPTKSCDRTVTSNQELPSASLRIDGTFEANGAIYSTAGGEGLSGTGVFINKVSASNSTLKECVSYGKESSAGVMGSDGKDTGVKTDSNGIAAVSVKPLIGNLAGVSANAEDYTKAFASGATYYGTPKTVDAQGNILKESAWYQYAINAVAADGQELCTGIVPENGDSMSVYSLGGYYETATFGGNTIDNVVGYVANGNGTTGTFNFKVVGYQVASITASGGTLTGPDANGVYSLSNITSNVTLTVKTTGDAEQYTLKYLMDDDSYAVYTSHGGTGTGETVEVSGVTYHVIAAPTGSAGSKVTPPTVTIPEGYSFNWQYTSGAVTDGTSINAEEAAASTNGTVYVIGVYRGNTAKNVTTGKEYQTLTEALAAVSSTGAEIQLLNDPGKYYEESGAWAIAPGLTVTLDLNGRTLAGSLANRGTLTLKDSSEAKAGKIVNSAAGTGDAVNKRSYALLNDSGATLTLESGTIQDTGATYSAGIINNCGTIAKIGAVDIRSTSNYAVYNNGGTITEITGTTITGRNGIYNRSVSGSTPSDGSPWTIAYTAKIGTIKDATVTCTYQYALWNGGQIDSICGASKFTSSGTEKYIVYNSNEIGSVNNGYYASRTDDGASRVYTYSDLYPTIKLITDSVEISSTTCDYGLYNAGKIETINGNVTISAKQRAVQVSAGGVIDTITDNVTISATAGERGISIESARSKKIEYTYDKELTANDKQLTKQITTYGEPSRIGTITGNVTISAKTNYGIINYGTIDTISGNVQIKAAAHGVSNQAADGAYSTYTTTYGTDVRTYDYMRNIAGAGHIGTIGPEGSDVRITVTGRTAVRNYGSIGLIGSGTTLTAKESTLYNADNRETRRVYKDTANKNKDGSYDTKREYLYVYGAIPEIETINGATITASNNTAVLNSGVIKTIQKAMVDATKDTIYNCNNGAMTGDRERARCYRSTTALKEWPTAEEWLFTEVDTSGIQYAVAQIDTIENCTITSNNGTAVRNGGKIGTISGNTIHAIGSSAIYNVDASRSASTRIATIEGTIGGTWTTTSPKDTVTAYSALPEIGTIGANTITSTSGNAIDNRGIITTLGADGLSVTANAGHAVYSADSLKLDSYKTESQTYAGQSCTVVTEITKSTAATTPTPAEIQTLTTGQYSASSGKYALYNNGSEAISVTAEALSPYRGPQFKSASSARAYAVYGPDNAAKQTYTSNGDQGTPVTLSAAANGDGWFYLVANTATVVFDPNGGAGTSSPQTINLSDASATITCPTFTKNQHEFLGFAVKADATEADFAVNESGALSIAVSALKSKTSAVAGGTITLYAVYKQSYLHTVNWTVTGVDGVKIEQTKIMTADETVTKSVEDLKLTGKYIIKSCTISPESGAKQTVTLPADNIKLTEITSDITVTLKLAAYDHIVTIKDTNNKVLQTQYVSVSGENVTDVLNNDKPVGYKVTGSQLIKGVTEANCTATISEDKTAVTVTKINGDATVKVTLVDYQYKVVVQNAGGTVLQTQYVSVSGENVTDVLDSSKPVGYTVTGQKLITKAAGENCNIELNAAKTEVKVTNITADATVTVTLAAYDHIVTVNATGGYSQTYYVKNNGNVLANNAPITYTAGDKKVISGVTVSPNGKATASHTATTATITDITDGVTVTVALASYDHIVTIKDTNDKVLQTQYVSADGKDVLDSSKLVGYTAGEKKVITNVTGHTATLTRGEGDVNAKVADGWKSFTLSGIKEDQTVAVTLKDYAHTVNWTRTEDNKGSTITTTRREYVAVNGSATLKLSEGFRATGVTGADSATVDKSQNGVVTISGIAKDLTVTVTARNYSYAVTWNVNGTESKTYLGLDEKTATYTAGENTVITDASVSSGSATQVTHTNTKVTVTGISSDVTVHVTTEAPTTDKATYYFGDMSYEYKRNTVLYQWDGKSEDKGQWIPVDSFAWQHKAGSRIYEFEGSTKRYVVPNGSVLLVNGSNQTMQYTVTYAPPAGESLANAVMTFTAGENTGENTLSVVLKPGDQAMVSSTFACEVNDQKLTNEAAGQVTVKMTPDNG